MSNRIRFLFQIKKNVYNNNSFLRTHAQKFVDPHDAAKIEI